MEGEKYRGLLSVDEVSSFILKENSGKRPLYHFVVDNFPKVLKGSFLRKGESRSFSAPIMVGAMRYVVFCRHMEALQGQAPILVVGDREDHIKKAIELQIPAIILTGIEQEITSNVDWDSYRGTVFVSALDTAETLRLLRLSVPVVQLMVQDPPSLQADTLFEEARDILAESEFRGLPVFDGDAYTGFVTRRCFLRKPKTKLIMVDHNETEQGVEGLEEAGWWKSSIITALGIKTQLIFSLNRSVRLCTIYTLFRNSVSPIGRVLLSGIISVPSCSRPTTTFEDYTAVRNSLSSRRLLDMVTGLR